jgi:4-amino-4-deoxy-L-arabinose transferase-like glycosyltransferase
MNQIAIDSNATQLANKWFWFIVSLHVILWTVLPILLRPTLPIDALEGVVWGQHLILGYDRNPWLNAWLTRLAVEIGGYSGWLTYLFSQLFVGLCFWSVWRLGRKILTPLHALAAVLILEGIQYYTIASLDFNDNVIELGLWALLVLLFYRAVTLEKLIDWIGVGIVAGLALMTKYYSAFLLIGMFLFLLIEPQARQVFSKKGIYIAAFIFLIIIAPHFIWLFQHDFVTLHYAQNRVDKGRMFTWWGYIRPTLRFAGNQLLDFAGALVLFSFLLWGKTTAANLAPAVTVKQFDKRFLWMIAATPFVLTLLLALLLGWQLYSLWGTPLLSLWGIILLIYTQPVITQARFNRFIAAVLIVIASIAVGYTISLLSPGSKATVNYPSRTVAHTVENIWHQKYHEPLKYIAGDRYTTFYVAVYSHDKPAAYIDWDPYKSPWINENAMRKAGAIFVQPIINGKQFPAEILKRFPNLKVETVLHFQRINVTADTPPVSLLIGILPPQSHS